MDEISKKEQMEDLERKIKDLKNRLPAHSVKPNMLHEIEELEEKLESLIKGT